jgi:hypothetical protein
VHGVHAPFDGASLIVLIGQFRHDSPPSAFPALPLSQRHAARLVEASVRVTDDGAHVSHVNALDRPAFQKLTAHLPHVCPAAASPMYPGSHAHALRDVLVSRSVPEFRVHVSQIAFAAGMALYVFTGHGVHAVASVVVPYPASHLQSAAAVLCSASVVEFPGHPVHGIVSACVGLYVPTAQLPHAAFPFPVNPGLQSHDSIDLLPLRLVVEPAVHPWHCVAVRFPAFQKPGSHAVHVPPSDLASPTNPSRHTHAVRASCPVVRVVEPAVQLEQSAFPTRGLNSPSAHAGHAAPPDASPPKPAEHWHAVTLVDCWMLFVSEPDGHAVHVAVAAAATEL